jgi:hypothetical protein
MQELVAPADAAGVCTLFMTAAGVFCAAFVVEPVAFAPWRYASEQCFMIDLIYVVGTVLFFALMIAYVAGCERLGRMADVERSEGDVR